eukprot:CAMPEP_0183736998 /NCGR_PEP_ID=MMETSP0737-20130205/50797_1 /TAXON_ID=385413 /ORGANISM="Thalassiosira miniscula, Strain CCMP1093" /LENGTH=985 /DNA_ID=CAMNT_0025971167 /DNA_START=130 /DNA_END=3087 /DNA_ORIENTATION=+
MAALGRKASELSAAASAAALANPFTRRVAEAISNATSKDQGNIKRGRRRGSGDDEDGERRFTESGTSYGFLDTMCGPMLRNYYVNESNDADDIASTRNRGGRRGRPTGSYDYDDETNATDNTGSYEEDDETYDDDSRRKPDKRSRGRDRKPRARSPTDSPSEMTGGYSEFDDDTTQNDTVTEASSAYHDRKESSSNKAKDYNSNKTQELQLEAASKESEKLITQPLASGFAKRCYFTKAGIGRSTQHYEGLTLTGNTVLMLAAAMKLKGCPTICDEDLRRVEQTYPNQFSRLPDELLLSSGWRRISKYCHFSHKPLPDGVPFFHSRKRCHPNGGFFFLLCSAVGMNRLMDVEPLNRDALAVLQTDYPMTCEKAPEYLMEDPNEWTLVSKFCFFSGGPINVEEDVYYRAELGGTEIYMLAFLSPSLSPEELYRLKPGTGEEDTGPLKSIAAVGEVESVYDLTGRDFDDLKLYHLGPCRALPPYLLHPETWTKVLPPRFMDAREEALRIAEDWESRYPPNGPSGSTSVAGNTISGATQGDTVGGMMAGENAGSGYVELGGGGRPPPSTRSGMPPIGPGGGPGYPPQYPGHGPVMHTPMNQQDSNYFSTQPAGGGMDQAGYPPHYHQQQQQHPQYGNNLVPPPSPMETDVNYFGASPGSNPGGTGMPPQGVVAPSPSSGPQYQQHTMPPQSNMNNSYGNPHMGPPSPDKSQMNPMGGGPSYDAGPHQQQPYLPQNMMGDPHWRDVQEEGAFGILEGGDQPHDETIATRGGMYGGMNDVSPGGGAGMMQHPMGPPIDMGPPMEPEYDEQFQYSDQFHHSDHQDPPDDERVSHNNKNQYNQYVDDGKSVISGTSSLMGGAQNRLKQNRMRKLEEKRTQRPDLSTKLGGNNKNTLNPGACDDSTWDTRTDGESSYGTSLVSGSSYTDTTNPNERNSRRALILQMAKARMKNVKEQSAVEKNDEGQGQEEYASGSEVPRDDLVDEVAGLELD